MTTRTVPPGHDSAIAADEGLDSGTWTTSRLTWPAEALTDPPEFPFKMDRHVYASPEMAAWREQNVPKR